jgi:hypothetical protein
MTSFRNTAVMALLTASLAIHVFAQNPGKPWNFPDFTATQVFHSDKYEMAMKVYHSDCSVRVERTAAISTLYATADQKVYDLTTYPDGSHQCVSMRPDQAKMLPSPLELLYGTKVKRIGKGTEVVDGHKCKVETAQVTRSDGSVIESKVWEAEDLKGAPVKIESHLPEITLTAVYRDIVLGTPGKALFTPPDKCTSYEHMGQVVEQEIIR